MFDYLTAAEFALWMKVQPETVRRWLRSGQVRGVRFGGPRGGWRIPASEKNRVMSSHGPHPVSGRTEKILNFGVIQDADGVMTHHMHPEGETLGGFMGDQVDGHPCVWCERGVPRMDAVKRIYEDGICRIEDAATGALIVAPYRLERQA